MIPRGTAEPVSLYIHVPFCPSKCAYCDFNSAAVDVDATIHRGVLGADPSALAITLSPLSLGDLYVDAVLTHIDTHAKRGLLGRVPTVYIGGGTPTLLGGRLLRIVDRIRALPGLATDAEFTVETNPETTNESLVGTLVAAGVNRFSLGVQSFDDAVLATLGRCHDAASAEKAAHVLRASGANFSVDLICGVPGQSEDSWCESVTRAVDTGAGHLSVYPLSIEEDTPLACAIDAGEMVMPDADTAAAMMQAAAALLHDAGLERYEVASYARRGQHSRHNSVYWTGGAYLGIGPGAASMLPMNRMRELRGSVECTPALAANGRVRFTWTETTEGFLGHAWEGEPALLETLTPEEALREDAMLGMRMAVGISSVLAEKAEATAVLQQLAEDGLVILADGRWRPTERGWLLGNRVFSAIWLGE